MKKNILSRRLRLVSRSVSFCRLLCATVLLSGTSVLSIQTARAQCAADTSPRPKIGLSLEGGGALGFAHVGVIAWLERHQIPVDYVSGTSMGSLVGGFYATGMNSAEIDNLLGQLDWANLFQATSPLELRDYRRREDYRAFQNSFEFGRKFSGATGLNPVNNVGMVFSRVMLGYDETESFDTLPIPFRCVAADVKDSSAKVFDRGSLTVAMRGSMAIPFVFTNINADGNAFVDGGIAENLPVSMMLPATRPDSWKPDILITVHLAEKTPPSKPTPQSPLSSVNQMMSGQINANVSRSLKAVEESAAKKEIISVPLAADISGFTLADFPKWRLLVKRGEEEAERNSAELLKYRLSDADWAIYLKAKAARRRSSFTPQALRITDQDTGKSLPENQRVGLTDQFSPFLGRELVSPFPTSESVKELTRAAEQVYGSGIYESVSFDQTKIDGKPALGIRARRKQYGPPFLLIGASYDNGIRSPIPQTYFHVRYNDLGIGNEGKDEFRADIFFGSTYRLSAEYLHPLMRNSRFFVAPYAYLGNNNIFLPRDQAGGADYRVREGAVGADIGSHFTKNSEGRIGFRLGSRSYDVPSGETNAQDAHGGLLAADARWTLDTQNDPTATYRGSYARVRASHYFKAPTTSGYGQAEADLRTALPLAHRLSLQGTIRGGAGFGKNAPTPEQFLLGGLNNLSSQKYGELRGVNFYYGSLGMIYQLTETSLALGGALHLQVKAETGGVHQQEGKDRNESDVQIMGILPTHIGPIAAGVGIGNRLRFMISVGRPL